MGADQPTKEKPLQLVYERLKLWLNNERQHGHEVRTRILTQQLIFELEYERDKQLVLQQTASDEFFEQTLEACRKKLAFLRVLSPSERQRKWLSKTVFPRIGASTRIPNRLTDKDTRFDYAKCKASWQTADFFIDLVARGEPDEFTEFVSDPQDFIKHREDKAFVSWTRQPCGSSYEARSK